MCARAGPAGDRLSAQVKANERADADAADVAAIAKDEALVAKSLEDQIKATAKAMEKIDIEPIVSDSDVMNRRKTLESLTKQLNSKLAALSSTAAKTRALKGTLQRYVDGMGLSQLKPKEYASGKADNAQTIGKEGSDVNIKFLTGTLVAAFKTIREERLVLRNEPVVPEMHRRKLPQLGSPTLQRAEIESEQLRATDDVRAAALEYRKRPREPCARQPKRTALPEITDALIESRVDVAWEMTYNKREGGQYVTTRWCPGMITRISTATTRSNGKLLGLGWIFVLYDDGESDWLLATRPSFFNKKLKPGAWRFEHDDDAGDDDDDDEEEAEEADLVDAEDADDEEEDDWDDL